MPKVHESPRERRLLGAKVAARVRGRLSGRGSLPARTTEGATVTAAGVGVRKASGHRVPERVTNRGSLCVVVREVHTEMERAEITVQVCCKMRGLPLFSQQTSLLQEKEGGVWWTGLYLIS